MHVFEVMVEDFSSKNLTLTYRDGTSAVRTGSDANAAPLCSVKLQFVIEGESRGAADNSILKRHEDL